MEVYLIRHTRPAIENGICYGQSDIPLCDSFEKEKEKVVSKLPDKLDIVYSSPLSRCRILSKSIDCPIKICDSRLKELNFGDWELKKWDDIDRDELDAWMENYIEAAPPCGESFMDLHGRVSNFLEDLKASPFQKVAIITHAGVLRTIFGILNKTDFRKIMEFKIAYGQVVKLHLQNKMSKQSNPFS